MVPRMQRFPDRVAVTLLAVVSGFGLGVGVLVTPVKSAGSQESLKVIDNPGGGRVLYGPVDQPTPQAAMAAVLRTVHTTLGAAPVVGKVFESKDGQNYGAFFTLDGQRDSKKIAGLVLVSLARGSAPAAAVLYDDAGRFAKTEPILLHRLTEAWRTASTPASTAAGTSSAAAGGSTSAALPPLTLTRFPDGSGAVQLPVDWRITFASHGSARIEARPYCSAIPWVQSMIQTIPRSRRGCATPIRATARCFVRTAMPSTRTSASCSVAASTPRFSSNSPNPSRPRAAPCRQC
jgi:hypothetical protein